MATSQMGAEIIVKGRDQATGELKKIETGMGGMASKASEVSAQFLLIKGAISQAVQMVDQFIQGAMNFDQAITRSAIAMGDDITSTKDLEEAVESLAETTLDGLYSHQKTAQAFQAIADEGRGLDGTLELVRRGMHLTAIQGGELDQNTKLLEDVMSAMNLTMEDSERIVDVLNNTWKETGATAGEVGPLIVQMGQVFAELGWSIEETSALIGTFKDVGQGAVQGLLSAFVQLTNENSAVSATFKEMGVSVRDSQGSLKTMPEIFLAVKKAGFDAADMLAAFGIRGSAQMIAAVNSLNKVIDVTESNLKSLGNAAEDAGEYGESTAAQYEKTKASMENLQKELATALLPVLEALMKLLKPILDLFSKYPEIIYVLIGAFAAYKISLVASSAVTWAHTIATGAATVAQWLLNAAMYACPLVWIILLVMAVVAAIWWLVDNWDAVVKGIGDGLAWLGEIWGDYTDWMGDQWDGMCDGMGKAWDNFTNWISEGAGWMQDSLGQWWDDMTKGVENFINDAVKWGEDLMNNFFKGIQDALDSSGDWLGDVGNDIQKWMGFSDPPEYGPLHFVPEWGKHLGESYLKGINTSMKNLGSNLDISNPRSMTYDSRDQSRSTQNVFHNRISIRSRTGGLSRGIDDPVYGRREAESIKDWLKQLTAAEDKT